MSAPFPSPSSAPRRKRRRRNRRSLRAHEDRGSVPLAQPAIRGVAPSPSPLPSLRSPSTSHSPRSRTRRNRLSRAAGVAAFVVGVSPFLHRCPVFEALRSTVRANPNLSFFPKLSVLAYGPSLSTAEPRRRHSPSTVASSSSLPDYSRW
jgi:hypothetical protein